MREKYQKCKITSMEIDFLNIAKFQNIFYEIWLCSKSHFLSLDKLIYILVFFLQKYMKKSRMLHLDLNLQPLASQADALSITPQGPLYKYVKINDIYIVCSFFYKANIHFFGNKLNNLNKWNFPSLNTQSALKSCKINLRKFEFFEFILEWNCFFRTAKILKFECTT